MGACLAINSCGGGVASCLAFFGAGGGGSSGCFGTIGGLCLVVVPSITILPTDSNGCLPYYSLL